MQLNFKYDIREDAENIKIAKNRFSGSKTYDLVVKKYGENFTEEQIYYFINDYLKENEINPEERLKIIEQQWNKISDAFFKKAEEIFKIKLPYDFVNVYLTISHCCSYSIQKKLFFVNIASESSNRIIMHELLHFYTWEVSGREIKEKNILSEEKYYDLKESLTELLNIEFKDLLNKGERDAGYTPHQEIRSLIKKWWTNDKDIKKIIDKTIDYLKNK